MRSSKSIFERGSDIPNQRRKTRNKIRDVEFERSGSDLLKHSSQSPRIMQNSGFNDYGLDSQYKSVTHGQYLSGLAPMKGMKKINLFVKPASFKDDIQKGKDSITNSSKSNSRSIQINSVINFYDATYAVGGRRMRKSRQIEDIDQSIKQDILTLIQPQIQRESGKPVQKLHSRVRSFQGGNSIYVDLHNRSQVFNTIMANEMAPREVRRSQQLDNMMLDDIASSNSNFKLKFNNRYRE